MDTARWYSLRYIQIEEEKAAATRAQAEADAAERRLREELAQQRAEYESQLQATRQEAAATSAAHAAVAMAKEVEADMAAATAATAEQAAANAAAKVTMLCPQSVDVPLTTHVVAFEQAARAEQDAKQQRDKLAAARRQARLKRVQAKRLNTQFQRSSLQLRSLSNCVRTVLPLIAEANAMAQAMAKPVR